MNIKQYFSHNFWWCLTILVNNIKQKVQVLVSYLPKRLLNSKIVHFRIILFFVLFLIILLLLNGRPKLIFKSYLHIPWLSSIEYVQPLKCFPDADQPEWPRPIQSNNESNKSDNYLTVVIVTARSQFNRLPATLAALSCHLDFRRISEVMFLVPPQDVQILEPYLSTKQAKHWPWLISLISDDILLKHIHINSYRLQMMFKLFLAQIVKTEYYLILDSDCLAVWPIHVEQLLYYNNLSSYKAIYQIEGKLGHPTWWAESEQLLQMRLEACVSTNTSSILTMGVTPSILSRTIALRTLCRLQKLYGEKKFVYKMANWALWRLLYGGMWTEYTLYFLTARCTRIFDTYHFHHSTLSSSNSMPALNLYGHSIWSAVDWTSHNQNQLIQSINTGLKWRQKEIEENNGQAIIDKSIGIHSLFTVLQGRHGVNPKLYHQLFYPLYIKYLQQQNQTEILVKMLNSMTNKLVTD